MEISGALSAAICVMPAIAVIVANVRGQHLLPRKSDESKDLFAPVQLTLGIVPISNATSQIVS
ncbi:hypothetical protein LJ655_04980 [Paraburkholderia sp. MMS20-SJTN17]|uniref:Uncharacterized protein n=1 Tax=Paraburkholderia translucens TaxID=2886945 RepID=A0ABS8K921_9BURK|nr:hypothetical protein [Paraburkholderia sp. MMS20-SJTN17]MCC8401255.1 hypothetical protein [Paraburkholderia sp. MMS20-SJTN17]